RHPARWARISPRSPLFLSSSLKSSTRRSEPLVLQQPRGAPGGRSFVQTKTWCLSLGMVDPVYHAHHHHLEGERSLRVGPESLARSRAFLKDEDGVARPRVDGVERNDLFL